MKFVKKAFFFIIICLLISPRLISQEPKQKTISCTYKNEDLKKVFEDLGKNYELDFYYTDQQIKNVSITVTINDKPLIKALDIILADTHLDYKIKDDTKIVIVRKKEPKMKEYEKKKFISGYVKSNSGEYLVGAQIIISNQNIGAVSNDHGYYCILALQDSIRLEAKYFGNKLSKDIFYLEKDTLINLVLSNIEIKGISITNSKDEAYETTQMSKLTLTQDQLKSLPAFLGEPDLIKTIQILPGIQKGIEGEGYLYVRGGGPEQNLILLENVPIYQSSHMLGLVPFFNSSAINRVEVLKGGFPARYSGRISSVVDIDLKNGNKKEYHGNINISPLMAELTLEGPIKKEQTSFILSGRRTYIDLIAKDYINSLKKGTNYDYQVYDISVKINHKISDKDNISLSVFNNQELAEYIYSFELPTGHNANKFALDIKNSIVSFEWNKLLSKNLNGKFQLFYNNTLNNIKNTETLSNSSSIKQNTSLNFVSSIANSSANFDFLYVPSNTHTIRFGLNGSYQTFNPASFNSLNLVNSTIPVAEEKYSFSDNYKVYGVKGYLEDDYNISNKLKASFGISYSFYKVNQKRYSYYEPRASFRYLLSDHASLKISYSSMHQYIHLLANYGYSLPLELWVPSNESIKPTISHQFVIGVSQAIKHQFELSLEAYYKTMNNMISFKDGSSIDLVKNDWKENITSGHGLSYGLEAFIQKKQGAVKGWIGYTLSWTERQFDEINNGEWFPYKYDRRHDFNITIIKTFLKNFELSASWIYGTGNAISLPLATYDTGGGWIATIYNKKNSYRLAPYHRLDLNFVYTRVKKKTISKWSLGLYNAYNRMNPFFIRYNEEENKFTQHSLFPIIPSISYNLKF
ncbi:MAG: TonB-dependent receptor [Bacteroidales bacterium]|nr:MAG: TonB-dependent receptor [Bacteroidales bacterium]